MRTYDELLPLVWFFKLNPHWFQMVKSAQAEPNGTIYFSTELWEDICLFLTGRAPVDKDDRIWDEILVNQRQLRHFGTLLKLSFFR